MTRARAAPVVDLDAIAAARPAREVRLSAELFRTLGNGRLMEVARLARVSLREVRFDRDNPETYAILPALAYVVLREAEPDLTLEDCWGFNYTVVGAPEVAADVPPESRANSAPTGE